MVTKDRQIDLKIKQKIMQHPYKNTSRIKPGVYLEIEGELLLWYLKKELAILGKSG